MYIRVKSLLGLLNSLYKNNYICILKTKKLQDSAILVVLQRRIISIFYTNNGADFVLSLFVSTVLQLNYN